MWLRHHLLDVVCSPQLWAQPPFCSVRIFLRRLRADPESPDPPLENNGNSIHNQGNRVTPFNMALSDLERAFT